MIKLCERIRVWIGPVVLSLFLLLIRLVWGFQFFLTGKGKLGDISKPIAYFTQLGIPMPTASAWLVACVECFGGILIAFGLAARPAALALTINMIVAYITADRDSLKVLFTDGDVPKFASAAPFWFLVAMVIILALGPGMFSLDAMLRRLFCRRPDELAQSDLLRERMR